VEESITSSKVDRRVKKRAREGMTFFVGVYSGK